MIASDRRGVLLGLGVGGNYERVQGFGAAIALSGGQVGGCAEHTLPLCSCFVACLVGLPCWLACLGETMQQLSG